MITQYTTINAAKYDELFAKASAALGTEMYVPVVVNSVSEFAQSIIDGTVYYTKSGDDYNVVTVTDENYGDIFDPEEQYYVQTGSIQTLEQYFCHLKDLLDLPNGYKYLMLPLDEPPLDIDANKRTINIPASFKTSGLSIEDDELAETLFFRIDRYFDAMDLSSCEIFVQWNLPNGETWVTAIYMIDVESEPGKLIFACPITSEITQASGAIDLAVRFIKRSGGDAISYSFSTLPARATIGAGLKVGEEFGLVRDEQVMNLFSAAIENSDVASGEPAPAPVFTELLGADNSMSTVDKIYLTGTNNTLTVKAETSPVGNISYEWYHTVSADGWAKKVQDQDTTGEYTITTQDDLVNIDDEDYTSKTATGIYQVRAINRLNNKTAKAWSDKVELPAPTKAELQALTNKVIKEGSAQVSINEVDGTNQPNAEYSYQWIRRMPNEVGYVPASPTEEEFYGDTTYYIYAEGDYEEASVYNAEAEYFVASEEQLFANTKDITTNQPGYYKVNVGIAQNGDIAYKLSNEIRITNMPTALIFKAEYAEDAENSKVCNVNAGETSIDLTNAFVNSIVQGDFTSDKISYDWYIDADGQGVLDENGDIKDNAINIEYDQTTPVISGLEDLTSNSVLRCVATNELNGEIARSESVAFLVVAQVVS